jgi:hypothetical protein
MAADSFKGALLGPQLYDKIKATIARVDGTPVGGAVSRIPTRFDDGVQQPAGSPLKLAAFTGTSLWVFMESRKISFMETDTAASSTTTLPLRITDSTATAVASMFSIPGVTSSASSATALVIVSKINGVWHVVSST